MLYFGQAAFWSATRGADGDPLADLRHPGPQLVGRFDLARERFLPPLDVGRPGSRSGVWDVWPAAGEVYFTTFFEEAGAVDPATGRVRRFTLGTGLNELAEGPGGTVLATRYGDEAPRGGDGEVIAIAPDGALAQRWPLEAPAGYRWRRRRRPGTPCGARSG